jgi:hypothetical protein
MRRLQQLLNDNLVWSGDSLFFFFKKNKFSCCVTNGGLLWKCSWLKPDGTQKDLFRNSSNIDGRPYIRTFESLTDWTETCIQECLDEYHTRYSSWKRVRHQRLGQPMETIYKHLQQKKLGSKTNIDNIGLFEEIAALSATVEQHKKMLQNWEEWYKAKNIGLELPFSYDAETETTQSSSSSSSSSSSEAQTQPFILNSEEGRYMILHHLNQPASSECTELSEIEQFESVDDNIQNAVTFDPPRNIDDIWAPVDANTCKRFVHNFFNPGK